jgi:hypothetical protein
MIMAESALGHQGIDYYLLMKCVVFFEMAPINNSLLHNLVPNQLNKATFLQIEKKILS